MICTGEIYVTYWGGLRYVLGMFILCTGEGYDMYGELEWFVICTGDG